MSEKLILPLSVEGIRKIIPHRYPFLLVDRLIEFEDGKGAVGIKNVTVNEPFFTGHFPDRPIMPGVLIIEALAQMGVLYAKLSSMNPKNENSLVVFSGCESVRFRRQVVPGDTLRLEVDFLKKRFTHWKIQTRALVDGEIAVEGILTATEIV